MEICSCQQEHYVSGWFLHVDGDREVGDREKRGWKVYGRWEAGEKGKNYATGFIGIVLSPHGEKVLIIVMMMMMMMMVHILAEKP